LDTSKSRKLDYTCSVYILRVLFSLDKFLFHAQQFGFFLHIPSFRHSSLLAFALGHPSRPTPGLLYVAHLLGVHFSDAFPGQETALLTRAVQHVATDLMSSHPNKVIHTLQAEILLSYYFLRTGALLEAKCRAGTAVALALGAGLHKIRSINFLVPSTIGIGAHDHAYSLPLPNDNLHEAERINGFWAVFVLHKFITVALEVPAHVCGALEAPGMQIDTPWPLDMDHYEEVRFLSQSYMVAISLIATFSGCHSAGSARKLDRENLFERLPIGSSWRFCHHVSGEGFYIVSSCCTFNWAMVS